MLIKGPKKIAPKLENFEKIFSLRERKSTAKMSSGQLKRSFDNPADNILEKFSKIFRPANGTLAQKSFFPKEIIRRFLSILTMQL